MNRAQATWLPDRRRLHLHHGPIDMIVDVTGPGRQAALERAVLRFDTLLQELVDALPRLRSETGPMPVGEAARRMVQATRPFAADRFVTPMAAVAGAGADTILRAICAGPDVDKAYVNNGGDIAFHLTGGQDMRVALAADDTARVVIGQNDPVRGVATSGWRGRSQSLGIADSVTVLAQNAVVADVAATLIANAVNLAGHRAITRAPAYDLNPDSDLGDRLVTVDVGPLTPGEVVLALDAGADFATQCHTHGLIAGAAILLQGQTRYVGHVPMMSFHETEKLHA